MLLTVQSLSLFLCSFLHSGSAVKEGKESLIQAKNKWDRNGFVAYCPCMGKKIGHLEVFVVMFP